MEKKINIKSIHEVNTGLQNLILSEPMFHNIYIRGEIGTLTYWGPGGTKIMSYFTLKEKHDGKDYNLSCAMSLKSARMPKDGIRSGMNVVVRGDLAANPQRGDYQFRVSEVILESELGQSQEELEKLKAELEELGMFAPEYKQKLPKMARTVGVVTSNTGAVIGDIISVAQRKNPYTQIILYPTMVSSDKAVAGMVEAIKALEAYPVDVIIIGRGGGSDEELWVYNNREIAEAVFNCSVPTISAVGHTKNKTILDLVVDKFAITPTEAADYAVYDLVSELKKLDVFNERLNEKMKSKIRLSRTELTAMKNKLMAYNPKERVGLSKAKAQRYEEILNTLMRRALDDKKHLLSLYIEKMKGLSPLDKLNQGYSYVSKDHKTLNSIENVSVDDKINIFVKDGVLDATITDVKSISY